jgi:hypothetical protein
MISFVSAGLRVFDIRHPEAPVEVAYFNHGSTGTKPLYNPETKQIWLTAGSGFWVLELEPQVRQALGLPD